MGSVPGATLAPPPPPWLQAGLALVQICTKWGLELRGPEGSPEQALWFHTPQWGSGAP
jgi:hypothetical protein